MSVLSDLVFLGHLVCAKIGLRSPPPPVTRLEVRSAALTSEPGRPSQVVLASDVGQQTDVGPDDVFQLRVLSCVVQTGPLNLGSSPLGLEHDLLAHRLRAILSLLSLQLASNALGCASQLTLSASRAHRAKPPSSSCRLFQMRTAVRRSRAGHSQKQLCKTRHVSQRCKIRYLRVPRSCSSCSPLRVKAYPYVSTRALLLDAVAPMLEMIEPVRHSCKMFTKSPHCCEPRFGNSGPSRPVLGMFPHSIPMSRERIVSFGTRLFRSLPTAFRSALRAIAAVGRGFSGKALPSEPSRHCGAFLQAQQSQQAPLWHLASVSPSGVSVSGEHPRLGADADAGMLQVRRSLWVRCPSLAGKLFGIQATAGRCAPSLRSASQHLWDVSAPLPVYAPCAGICQRSLHQVQQVRQRLAAQKLDSLKPSTLQSSSRTLQEAFSDRRGHQGRILQWLRLCKSSSVQLLSLCPKQCRARRTAAWLTASGPPAQAKGCVWKHPLHAAKLRRFGVCRRLFRRWHGTGMLFRLNRKRFSLQIPYLHFKYRFVIGMPGIHPAKSRCLLPKSSQKAGSIGLCGSYPMLPLPASKQSSEREWIAFAQRRLLQYQQEHVAQLQILSEAHSLQPSLRKPMPLCLASRPQRAKPMTSLLRKPPEITCPLIGRHKCRPLELSMVCSFGGLHLAEFRSRPVARRHWHQRQRQFPLQYLSQLLQLLSSSVRLPKARPLKAQICKASGTMATAVLKSLSFSAPKLRLLHLRRAPQYDYPLLLGRGRSGKLLTPLESESSPCERGTIRDTLDGQMSFKATSVRKAKR